MSTFLTVVGQRRSFGVSERRIARMLSDDKSKATCMGLWDKIKDLFRPEKKQDVLNRLYNFIHQDEQGPYSRLEALVHSFNRIKEMAEPAHHSLFKIEEDINSNINFTIGTVRIYQQNRAQLSENDLSFFDEYNTRRLNSDESVKDKFSACIKDRLCFDSNLKENKQLFLDIHRLSYKFDGFDMSCDDGVASATKKDRLAAFLEKLTPQQQKSLNIVGSQIGPIELKNTLSILSDKHVFVGNPSVKIEFYIDAASDKLMVHLMMQQDEAPDKFETLRDMFGGNARYPTLSLQTTFSIEKNGETFCTDFNVANTKVF